MKGENGLHGACQGAAFRVGLLVVGPRKEIRTLQPYVGILHQRHHVMEPTRRNAIAHGET